MGKRVVSMTRARTSDRIKLVVAALVACAVAGGLAYVVTMIVG